VLSVCEELEMSLYGIESEDDCRAVLDELLELNARAERAVEHRMDHESISLLKRRLEEMFKKGDTERGKRQMSQVERQYFWPTIREAYIKAPRLNSPTTWRDRLYEVGSKLRDNRPEKKK
jgi:predicted transcriptional regulator